MRIPSVFDALSVISRRHDDSIPSAAERGRSAIHRRKPPSAVSDGAASGVTPTWRVYGGIQGSRRG